MQNKSKIAILLTFLFFIGCKKEDATPVAPVIKFVEANVASNNASAVVKIEFLDKNGDLGLKQEENSGEQKYNVFVDYYEKIDGEWILKSPIVTPRQDITSPSGWVYDTTNTNVRIPFLENDAQRALQGEVKLDLLLDGLSFFESLGADTFKYDIYIKDRSLRSSNVITTTELIID
ncbi:hypothetical protein N9242_01850 [Vicingaceae bacterium]|nr:hypothetical protein [Vicingaceae bacterium]